MMTSLNCYALRIGYRFLSNFWQVRRGVDILAQWLEHWNFNPAARVQIEPESRGFFFSLICYALFFVTAFMSEE